MEGHLTRLPIDIVTTHPQLRFVWRAKVPEHMSGRVVECSGSLPPGVDMAVAALIDLAKRQAAELTDLRERAGQAQPTT